MNARLQALYERSPIFLQNLAVSLQGLVTRRQRMDAAFTDRLAWLAETESWPAERMRAYQTERLRAVLDAAYASIPFYRRAMDERGVSPADLRQPEDLRRLPVLRRSDVHAHGRDMLSRTARRRELLLGHTSGTTGSPLEFWWDRSVSVWNNVMLHRARGWAGYRFGDRTATLLGNVIVPLRQQAPPFWRSCRPWNKIFFSSFHLEERHLSAYVAELRARSPLWLEAYPSTADVVARFLESRGEVLPLRGVFLSSETLTAAQRRRIEERFATRVWDGYSVSERVIFAAECEAHQGQHLFPEFGAVEVLDEKDEPLPEGRPGRLVATGLHNLAMPLVRYDTGDVGGIDPTPCACGRRLPKLLPITTKAEDIVVTASGRMVSASVLTHPFKPMVNIEKSQIVQEAPDHVVVRIVRRPAYGEADSRRLLAALHERLGDDMRIELEFVTDIPRSARGKYRWVVSRVPLRFGASIDRNLFWSEDDPASTPGR